AAVAMAAAALLQNGDPYPYNLHEPATFEEARNMMLSYPVNPQVHLSMLRQFGDTIDPATRSREIATATWLDPTDHFARDSYVRDLLAQGKRSEAMEQVTESVYAVPITQKHPYLEPRLVPWLRHDERQAIEHGLRRAVDRKFKGAAITLGDFYSALGRSG